MAAWVELRGARHSGTLNQMEERRDAELVKVLEEVDQLTAYVPPRVTTLRRVLLARHEYMLLLRGATGVGAMMVWYDSAKTAMADALKQVRQCAGSSRSPLEWVGSACSQSLTVAGGAVVQGIFDLSRARYSMGTSRVSAAVGLGFGGLWLPLRTTLPLR